MKIKVKNIISKIAAVGVMILLVFSAMTNVAFAADTETALETVKALGITTGENLGSSVTRAEFAKMLVSASVYKDEVGTDSANSLYKDVQKNHWAVEYIKIAVEQGWMTGYSDGTFRPVSYTHLDYRKARHILLFRPQALLFSVPLRRLSYHG